MYYIAPCNAHTIQKELCQSGQGERSYGPSGEGILVPEVLLTGLGWGGRESARDAGRRRRQQRRHAGSGQREKQRCRRHQRRALMRYSTPGILGQRSGCYR